MLESSFNKVAGLKVCIFIKKKIPTQLFFCEYCEILKNSFFMYRLTTFGTKLIFLIILVSLLCFPSWLYYNQYFMVIPYLFSYQNLTLVKCNFRTHYNVGSSTILTEWLMFRNNPVTVTSPSNLL